MELLTYPNKILEKKSESVEKIDANLLKLAADMKKLLKTIDGIGLAAPQIGKNTRLCVVGYYYKDCKV